MVGSTALDRARNDVLGFLIRFLLGFGLDFLNHHGSLVSNLLFGIGEQDRFCLLCRITGDPLQFFHLLGYNKF